MNHEEIAQSIAQTRVLMSKEKGLSPALRSAIEMILTLVSLMINQITLNSRNSSIPPSQDKNRKKEARIKGERKPGAQKGHKGSRLIQVENPDEIKVLEVDLSLLPQDEYKIVGYEKRQVFDIDISSYVVEYQAQIVENKKGERFKASFPKEVTAQVQYGLGVKVQSVYLSQYQLIPYNRVSAHFEENMNLGISEGSIYNFNLEAYNALESFEKWLQQTMISQALLHADETGINVDGKNIWLHCLCNQHYTYFHVDTQRGKEAMDRAKVLPQFQGILVHDHWKPYYRYEAITHALCNAHHLRELQRAYEQDKQEWAKEMLDLLIEMNQEVSSTAQTKLSDEKTKHYRQLYDAILSKANIESPPPDESKRREGQRGRLKRTKSRALLERLRDYKEDTLRFLDNDIIPFTNNQGENDIRMTKVHQKISGSFRSYKGAEIFCRVRSYLSTCRKHDITASEALMSLFSGKLPEVFGVGE